MKKIISVFLLFFSVLAFSQFGASIPTTRVGGGNSKWTFGGYAGLGGSFGSGGGTSLYITPRVGYKVAENFELGVAGNFTWNNSSYYSSTMFGIGPFANFYIGRSVYLSGMFQEFFVNQTVNSQKYSTNESTLYLGGGYMQRVGEHLYMQIGFMYNVLYDSNKSVFGGGFIPNVGIVYGL